MPLFRISVREIRSLIVEADNAYEVWSGGYIVEDDEDVFDSEIISVESYEERKDDE